ncbi:Lipocalin-like [Pedobacter steynii]|uniref:Lipocalin-like n=1 Tax=Pedobacter steynii TaxID=430522 RepID=A0A1H0G352_9SPHI|nr:lipocalin family protein [Pedobacter steynii]NQX42308.1 lipocalin family protein [Pedobacter steynii]SDO01348.1 Lipocalin-like [Pedobacter steynii]
MIKNTLLGAMLIVATSCSQTSQQNAQNEKKSGPETENSTSLLIGSWVEPNPINKNEVQGITISNDGTAKSINMATLVYKKWWKEDNKLVLVAESIGNGSSSLDTTKYEIIKLNDKELELKDRALTIYYKKK